MSAVTPAPTPAVSSVSAVRLAALTDTVRSALGDITITTAIPTTPQDDTRAITLSPLSLTRLGRLRNGETTVQLCLRVLAVPAGPDSLTDLETLLVALDQVRGLEVEQAEPPLTLWSLLGVPPQPAAIIRIDVPVTLPSTPLPLVLHPLQVDARTVISRDGVIIGPSGAGVGYGVVRAARYNHETRTDAGGRFRLPLPAGDDHVALVVQVKGRTFTVDAAVPPHGPILVHCDREETS